MNPSDVIFIVFLLACVWLAMNSDSGGGGGKRSRVAARA